MFNSIRKTIASMIMPSAVVIDVPAGTKSLTIGNEPKHILTQYERKHEQAAIVGDFHVSHLDELSSEYLRNAIASLGAWSALARGFAEYERVVNKRAANEQKLGQLFDEFHCWNAALPESSQMDEEAILVTADKLAQGQAIKGNAQTDAIIARVRKCSVEELKTDREVQAKKRMAARQELILGFTQACQSYTSTNMNPSVTAAKAAAKAVQTLEWVATSWQGEPAGIAAELLLIEADLKKIERMARDAEARSDETFQEGMLTTDGMTRQLQSGRKFGDETQDLTPKAREMIRVRKQA
jgi:hypothetical protein